MQNVSNGVNMGINTLDNEILIMDGTSNTNIGWVTGATSSFQDTYSTNVLTSKSHWQSLKTFRLDFSEVKTLKDAIAAVQAIGLIWGSAEMQIAEDTLKTLPKECRKFIKVRHDTPMEALKDDFDPIV